MNGFRRMKIEDLTHMEHGTRIRVVHVEPSEAEHLGYVDDTKRLLGQQGTVERLRRTSEFGSQLRVRWDDPEPGGLMLSSKDEIEVLER